MGDLPKSDVALLNRLFGELMCWPDKYQLLSCPDDRSQFLADLGLSSRGIEAVNQLDGGAFASVFHLAAAIDAGLNRA